jgi:phospholipid N-methyltransferase
MENYEIILTVNGVIRLKDYAPNESIAADVHDYYLDLVNSVKENIPNAQVAVYKHRVAA